MHTPRICILIGLLLSTFLARAQSQDGVEKATAKEKKEFVYFKIPVLINGSNIDPSPVTNLSVDLTGEELRLKVGFPGTFKGNNTWNKGQWFTASLSPYTSSKDKESTLFSKGSWTGTRGIDGGINILPYHIKWNATAEGAEAYEEWSNTRVKTKVDAVRRDTLHAGDRTTELVVWVAGRGNLERKEYTVFSPGSPFDALMDKRSLSLARGYGSINVFYHSALRWKRWGNFIASAGYGKGSFTNYTTLAERTLQEGAVVYNADSSNVRIISEETAGRVGPMVVTEGPVSYLEGYKTVAFLGSSGEIRLGVRYDMMGMGTSNFNTRLAPGIFINAKKPNEKKGEPPVDIVNVAIIFQMDQFQLDRDKEYWDNYATLSVSAAFPLRFK
jgi:hypothetical protein